MSSDSFLVCQISDLHIKLPGRLSYRKVDCARMLARCVEEILRLPQRPDCVVATGDLVDFGRPGEYAHLRTLLAPLPMPVYLIPGNHDEREALRASFADHAYLRQWPPFVQYTIEDWPLRIVALDTLIPGEGGGELCAERIAWLERALAARPERPTLVIMHHPPFPTLIGHMDEQGLLRGGDALAGVIARHPQVERVLCGHLHRPIQVRYAGTLASTCPAPAHQVALDLAPDARSAFRMEPPGFQLHAWKPGFGVISHTAFIGEFEGPFPFREDGKLID
ncbi:MAG TPA: phosphodiesterase [Burkholderiales bacterium]|nr:phosphodiesterase [Burkholderiales bacterium]